MLPIIDVQIESDASKNERPDSYPIDKFTRVALNVDVVIHDSKWFDTPLRNSRNKVRLTNHTGN